MAKARPEWMTETMTKSEAAVQYALQRVVDDPDFGWHLQHTETLRLLVLAEADRRGVSYCEVGKELNDLIPRLHDKCDKLYRQVQELLRRLNDLEVFDDDDDDDDQPRHHQEEISYGLRYLEDTQEEVQHLLQ